MDDVLFRYFNIVVIVLPMGQQCGAMVCLVLDETSATTTTP